MKRKVSFSFLLLCICTLAYIPQMIGIYSVVAGMFRTLDLMNIIDGLMTVLHRMIPVTLVLLLWFNRKGITQKSASAVLVGCGIVEISNVVLEIIYLTGYFRWSEDPLMYRQLSLLLIWLLVGIVYLLAASAIMKKDRTDFYVVLAMMALMLSVVPMAVLAVSGQGKFLADIGCVLLTAGLVTLPETLYNYEKCYFVNSKILITVICVIAIFSVAIFFGDGGSSSSSTGVYRCNNCGGDGWDSANNCSCVWCGGDGKTVWNP